MVSSWIVYNAFQMYKNAARNNNNNMIEKRRDERRRKKKHEQRVHECKQMEKWEQDVCASAQFFF